MLIPPEELHRICESDPIHIPGSVKPHVTLVVLSGSHVVTAASESCAPLLGERAGSLLGQPLSAHFDEGSIRAVQASLMAPDGGGHVPRIVATSTAGRSLELRIHVDEGRVLIDIEPWDAAAERSTAMIPEAVNGLSALRTLTEPRDIAQGTARLVRQLTGFDRVLVNRFDDEWNGEVIAEARTAEAASYLGRNFSASDIPARARELCRTVEVRRILDALYVPSPLRADTPGIDIGKSGLRSVSPFLLEYMHNMGVRASLVGSLLDKGVLWGLIACHHIDAPRRLSMLERDVFHVVCQAASALLMSAESEARATRVQAMERHQVRLPDAVHDGGIEGLMAGDRVRDLLGVVAVDGFACIGERGVRSAGATPSPAQILALRASLVAHGHVPDVFVPHSLRNDLGVADVDGRGAGAIMLPVIGCHGIPLMWFRDERKRSVHRGGNPRRAVETDERGIVSPRKSFAAFLEHIEGESVHWRPEEVDSAHRLKELIEVAVQRTLRAESELLRTALTSLDEMVIVTEAEPIDEPGPRIVMVSEAVERLTGYTAEELIGRSPRLFQGELTDRAELDRLRVGMTRRERVRVEVVNYTKDSRPSWVELDLAPIADEKGWFTHWICVQRDIGERRHAVAELEAQRDRLAALVDAWRKAKDDTDRANDAKSLFLANMSHELRTPMHAIMSFSQLGLERAATGDTERPARYFGNINESGARLTMLLNDLLDLSKLGAGRMEMHKVPTDLAEVVRQCAAEFDPLLAARSLRLVFVPPDEPVVVEVDPMRIGQVLRNLLSNAIKFSHDGGCVEVMIARVPADGEGAAGVRLTVDDAGVGTPGDELEAVLDNFVQSSKTRHGLRRHRPRPRDLPGTRDRPWRMVRADQRRPQGTRFEVVLPVG